MSNPSEYAFTFEVGLKPEFNLADLRQSSAHCIQNTVTDEMIDSELEKLQIHTEK